MGQINSALSFLCQRTLLRLLTFLLGSISMILSVLTSFCKKGVLENFTLLLINTVLVIIQEILQTTIFILDASAVTTEF